MLAYSEIIKEGADTDDPKNICIRQKNLKKYILAVLKLALCSSSEIILDYPVEKLAEATAKKCIEYAMSKEDGGEGKVSLEQVHRFVETAKPLAIFATQT